MSSPTLTRRGRVVAAVCVVGVGMALAAGGRSIEAVVLPGAVALAAGYVQLTRIDEPAVERRLPPEGFVGEGGEVELAFRGRGADDAVSPAYVADVDDALDDGLAGPAEPVRTTVGDAHATYRVRYRRRGERRFGPVTVTASDVFGLFEREAVVDAVDTTLAYPACREIRTGFRRSLHADDAVGASRRREEFDRLREYTRGDPVRDVHWGATAKHDEIVVKAFAAETKRGRVAIAGEVAAGRRAGDDGEPRRNDREPGGDDRGPEGDDREPADALASAAASLALGLLDDGASIDLTLPGGEVSADPGPRGRRAVLELAARTPPGTVEDEAADVRVVADEAGARYRVGDRSVAFDEVAGPTVGEGTVGGADGDAIGAGEARIDGPDGAGADGAGGAAPEDVAAGDVPAGDVAAGDVAAEGAESANRDGVVGR